MTCDSLIQASEGWVIPEVASFKEEGLMTQEQGMRRRKRKVENLLVQGGIEPGSPA